VLLRRTSSLEDALEGLASVAPTAQATAFFDSVVAAAHTLRNIGRPDTRRVLVALSDGEDNRSTAYELADVLREVQASDCLFYSINPSGRSLRMNTVSLRGQEALEAVAQHTGGASYVADRLEDLSDFYGRVAAVLKSQYLLEYYSPDTGFDGGYRRITVRVPSQPYLQVRARQGYYATAPSR
jgi:VWFA-related protein